MIGNPIQAPLNLKEILLDNLKISPTDFSGKTVVVTGAGRGIGFQIARAFAMLGFQVVMAEKSQESGLEAQRMIRAEGGRAWFEHCDVSKTTDVSQLANLTLARFGAVDILINNAIRIAVQPVVDMREDGWDEIVAVNLRGTFLTCKKFLPGMLANKKGVIINMISTEAMPGLSAYIATKQGILGFSQSLALETDVHEIQVIPFAPGMVDTPGIREIADELAPRLGMTREQFLTLSLHSAYSGLMPPEHAAVATALLALRYAQEYHGQPVNGYEVLERAGFLRKTELLPEEHLSPIPQSKSQKRDVDQIPSLLAQLGQNLTETMLEFNQLPVFVRPLARSGFKAKAGGSLDDWVKRVEEVKSLNISGLSVEIKSKFNDQLDKLAVYYLGVPGETARFTRDPETLRTVREISNRRVAVIRQIQNLLNSQEGD